MKPKIILLNDYRKCLCVKKIFCQWKIDVLFFQKTKLKIVNYSIVNILWSYCWTGWVELVYEGILANIVIMWDKGVVELVEHYVENI